MNQNIIYRNHVKISGNGKQTILFANGFGCDQTMWRSVAKEFEEDYRVVLFDYVGSGKSDIQAYDSNRYNDLSGYAQDVLDICEALELKDVIFVGHSVGSMIGALASIAQPERFERLILVGPSPCYLNDPPNYFGGFTREDLLGLIDMMERNYIGWAKFFAPTVMNNSDRPELTEELEESFCSTDPIIARQFALATFFADNRSDLSKVSVPSLILQCSQDVIASYEVGQYVHQQLHNSIFTLMKATGHCPHLSHPEETISHIRQFLNNKSIHTGAD